MKFPHFLRLFIKHSISDTFPFFISKILLTRCNGLPYIRHQMIECGQTRDVNRPHEVWESKSIGWEWRVLKRYKSPQTIDGVPQLFCFCAVKSPFTGISYHLRDVYISDIIAKGGSVVDSRVVAHW